MENALSKVLGDVSLHQVEDKEGEVLEILTASIAEMLEKEPDLLLSSMYRMDIDERKILQILNSHSENDIPTEFAISTQSLNGKNASEAITAPDKSKLKFLALSTA